MKLMVVESPNKVETLADILGGGWTVLPSGGHIRDLPKNEYGISGDAFELDYVYTDATPIPNGGGRKFPGGKDRVDKIRKVIGSADMVYLATDPDREGEAIAWHLKDALGISERDYQRVTFTAIASDEVNAALADPRKIDMHLFRAQEARRALDRMVGYRVSPVLSDNLGANVSAGRVQSPAVRLVVERDIARRSFKPTDHFGASVSFDGGKWKAQWDSAPFLPAGSEYMLDGAMAERASKCRRFDVVDSKNEKRRKAPPKPFSTSLLLQAASNALRFNPQATARISQRLFEQGVITYHRTDSVNHSPGGIEEIREVAATKGLPLPEKPRKWKERKDAQAGHEAIRPKHMNVEEAGDTAEEKALYRLIWTRTMASQLADAVYSENTLRLKSTDSDEGFQFVAKGSVLVDAGWRSFMALDAIAEQAPKEEGAESDEGKDGPVPLLDFGMTKSADDGSVLRKRTRAPERYTLASLVEALEAYGIGRPATYPSIMANILSKALIVEDKNLFLSSTQAGVDMVVALVKYGFSFIELSYTRDMEAQLDRVALGEISYLDVVAPASAQLEAELARIANDPASKPKHACPKCSRGMRRFVKDGRPYWACSGRDEGCETFLDDLNGKPLARIDYPCPENDGGMLRRMRRKVGGTVFWACSHEGCKVFMDDAEGKPVAQKVYPCPKCKSRLRRVKGKSGFFWSCTAYTETQCDGTMDDKAGVPVARPVHPCPKCKRVMRRLKGPKGFFWGCTGFAQGCKTTLPDEKGKPGKAGGR